MTNSIAAIASPGTVDYCKAIVAFGLQFGRYFIIAAFVLAIVETFAVIVIKCIQAKKEAAKFTIDDATKFLEALKGVLVALASLPAWIAIYLAGLTLLWIATHSGPCP